MRRGNSSFKKSRVFGWITLIEIIVTGVLAVLTIILNIYGINGDTIGVMEWIVICFNALFIPLFFIVTRCPHCGCFCIPCRPFAKDLGKCRKCDNLVEYA